MKRLFPIIFLVLSACMVRPGVAQNPNNASANEMSSFDACVQAGYEVIRTYPTRCITPQHKVYYKETTKKAGPGLCKDLCGDGVCQQIVCMGENCPCAETPVNCATDCIARD